MAATEGDAIFAMVANRALAPSSNLTLGEWAVQGVHPDIDQPIQTQHLYRSMNFLLVHQDEIQKKVFWSMDRGMTSKAQLKHKPFS